MKNFFIDSLLERIKISHKESLDVLIELLACVSKANICFYATVNDDLTYANTEVVFAHGKIVSNFTYSLKNTPCMHALCEEESVFPSNVVNAFPEDILLAQLNIEGYVGSPVFNNQKKHIGILVGLYEENINHIDEVTQLYQVTSALIALQFEKQSLENENKFLSEEDIEEIKKRFDT